MPTYLIETNALTYRFSNGEDVLNDINMRVSEGCIYGFLGPNGAGKTTTLRLILGLLKKQQGKITIFGKSFENNRVEILKQIGSLIESPSLYGHLTAFENLTLLQKIYRCPKERIQEVLNLVGLPSTNNKKVSQFSLGMKQRLSISVALLHNPSLLILDEPTNGLDPNGIIEIRELLMRLNKEQGITTVISSHLLPEMEKMVSHVGVINKGKMMFQGTLEELKSKKNESSSITFETNDNEKTIQVMSHNNLTHKNERGRVIIPSVSRIVIAKITQQLVNDGVEVYGISTSQNDLEAIFMNLVNI